MKIAFHLTTPPAPIPALDAAVREVEQLRAEFGGSLCHLYPTAVYRPWVPRRWLRAKQIAALEAADEKVDLHHFSSDRLFDHRVLHRLRRPLICRLLTCPTDRRVAMRDSRVYRTVVVSSPLDAERLRSWGLADVRVIPPGIELGRYRNVGAPPEGPFTLMMASAPWTRRQFVTKGVDALLEALRSRPHMRLVLLWRGVLTAEVRRRIDRAGLSDRVELLAEAVDVTEPMSRAHVVVLATTSPRVVRAYPHSLIEGLAAGRPILTSPVISLAETVRAHGCGEVAACTASALGGALDRLERDYPAYRAASAGLDLESFSSARYLRSYRDLFTGIAGGGQISPAER